MKVRVKDWFEKESKYCRRYELKNWCLMAPFGENQKLYGHLLGDDAITAAAKEQAKTDVWKQCKNRSAVYQDQLNRQLVSRSYWIYADKKGFKLCDENGNGWFYEIVI